MAFEQGRDLRSIARDTKRIKDHNHKWARGSRPSPGVTRSWLEPGLFTTGSEEQQKKTRPERFPHDRRIRSQNINKPNINATVRHDIPQSHSRAKAAAVVELQDPSNVSRSLHELFPSHHPQLQLSVSDDFLYSFDKTESPGKPLSLDVFVKTNTKETEKFVQKEYEILDYNGDAIKGRKALKSLHRSRMAPAAEEAELLEDDGFELV
ncbi:hypothetical protein F5Y19DRAFT_380470 [Xylariaceae sp. FL1651]|nr:hypothetical protein F5Y19DRAFT_380470 [Xylariaceae sp. FL1651]